MEYPMSSAGAMLDSVKSMFVKENGGIKWRTLALIGVGALGGAYFLPMMGILEGLPIIAGVVGAGAGLMGGGLLDKLKPEPEEAAPPAVVGKPAAAADKLESEPEVTAPAVTPGTPPRARAHR